MRADDERSLFISRVSHTNLSIIRSIANEERQSNAASLPSILIYTCAQTSQNTRHINSPRLLPRRVRLKGAQLPCLAGEQAEIKQ
jgi:hypothetical protein